MLPLLPLLAWSVENDHPEVLMTCQLEVYRRDGGIPVTDAYSNTSTMGSFAFAQNFDSFMHKSTDMTVGMNTLAQPTFMNMTYPASVSIANRFDTFAHFDAIIEIDDAGLRMRY
jgi:hypothetical protein